VLTLFPLEAVAVGSLDLIPLAAEVFRIQIQFIIPLDEQVAKEKGAFKPPQTSTFHSAADMDVLVVCGA